MKATKIKHAEKTVANLYRAHTQLFHFLFLFLFSYFVMLIFTKSSPAYYLNDWVDANAFFTVGKGMVHGLVPYRDLFEQKGPLLYAIHAVAYLISRQSFFGVYLMQGLALSLSLVFFYRIARYYLSSLQALWASMLLIIFYFFQPFYRQGDSAEEFTFPLVMLLCYFIFRLEFEPEKIRNWEFMLQGFAMGCVFWIKFTLIGAWAGFFLMLALIWILKRRWKNLFHIILWSVGGFVLAALPWLIYLGAHGALGDLIDVYLLFNIRYYPSNDGFLTQLINGGVLFMKSFVSYPLVFGMIFLGLGVLLFSDQIMKQTQSKFLLSAAFFMTGLLAFYGGKTYPYYYLILMPFSFIGILLLMRTLLHKQPPQRLKRSIPATFLVFCYSIGMTFAFNQNILQSKFFPNNSSVILEAEDPDKRYLPMQLTFARIIQKEENPTLLNYGFLDAGLYTHADILPTERYFERQNVDYETYPDNMDAQNRVIRNQEVDFVLVRQKKDQTLQKRAETYEGEEYDYAALLENYQVVASHTQEVAREYTYYLLKRNDI